MKSRSALLCASLALIIFSCSKSNNDGSNPTPPVDSVALLKTQLSGKWNDSKYSATDFRNTVSGTTSWTPTHSETFQISADSVHFDTWETMLLDFTQTPIAFVVTQNKEFTGGAALTVGKGFFIETSTSFRDTVNVVSISSTQMETVTRVSINGVYQYNLHVTYQR